MSERAGRLRFAEVVAGTEDARKERTTPIRDAISRISDTRVRCMPAVAKRGRTRFVALVTTERPVHERTLARTVRALARRFGWRAVMVVDRVMAACRGEGSSERNLPRMPGESTPMQFRASSVARWDM